MPKVNPVKASKHYNEIEKLFKDNYGKRSMKDIYKDINLIDTNITYNNFIWWQKRYRETFLTDHKQTIHNEKVKKKKLVHTDDWEEYRGDIVGFAHNVLGIQLHEGQQRWLVESLKNKKNVLVPANQFGKTFATAVKHIYFNYYKIGIPTKIRDIVIYETMDLSPKLRQVRALYSYIIQILSGQMWWEDPKTSDVMLNDKGLKIKGFLKHPKAIPSTNQLSQTPIEFANGSKMHAASTGSDMAAGLQGGQYPYISYDECPLSHNLEEELPARIMSRLIRFGGSIDLIGTPDDISPSFMYYKRLVEQGEKGEQGWITHFGKLDDNIFIPEQNRIDIKQAIKSTDPLKYRQVVFGDFVSGSRLVFRPEYIKNMWIPEMLPTEEQSGAHIVKQPILHHNYVIGVDWAISHDYTVMIVLDYTSDAWEIVYFYRIKGSDKPPQEQYLDLLDLKARYHADVMMDTNGLGGKLIESEFRDEVGMHGFNFAPGKKTGFIAALQKALHWNSEGRIRSAFFKDIEDELTAYKVDDRKLRQDIVMALGLCTWYLEEQEDLPEAIPYYN